MSPTPPAPPPPPMDELPSAIRLRWRLAYVTSLWLASGICLSVLLRFSVPLEAGYDRLHEFLRAVLTAPLLAGIGLTHLFTSPGNSPVAGWMSFAVLIILTVTLISTRRQKPFTSMAFGYALIVCAAHWGYYRYACYWELHGHG